MSKECCTPAGCLSLAAGDGQEIVLDCDAVKVLCNNELCVTSGLMHRQCFEHWEASVLQYLRSCGRARNWSERQRCQNLWTKKGYDLAFKACGCVCGRGHLRLDNSEDDQKKKKKSIVKLTSATAKSSAAQLMMNNQMRHRANSLSSTGSTASSSGSSSPPETVTGNGSAVFFLNSNKKRTNVKPDERESSKIESGNSGLFVHRANFSAFNALPRHKLNSHHIKMEDEGSYGNDDIRCFILSNLATAKMSKTFCVVCQSAMQIYDRYPLIDGTFFLSPKQYSKACIPVTSEGRQQHLSAVCMSCLEGWTCTLRCRSCRTPWNGGSLILGTLYSYDVFAAVPCCPERLRCNQCSGLVVQPDQRFQYFSHYSRDMSCPHCAIHEHHFVKPLPSVFQLFRSSGNVAMSNPPTI